jgi:hypothetical protein
VQHLRKLRVEWNRDFIRSALTEEWVGKKDRRVPREEFIRKGLEAHAKRQPEESFSDLDLPANEKIVLQLVDGEPVGYAKYRRGKNPFINALFVRPDMRDTLGDAEPVFDKEGNCVEFEPPKEKRKQPLLLWKRMLDFIEEREGAKPRSSPISPQGERIIKKYSGR